MFLFQGLLRADRMSISRYVDLDQFDQMLVRVRREANWKYTKAFFDILAEVKRFAGGISRIVVDLKFLIELLDTAGCDERRSFGDRSSNISTSIEFWSQKRWSKSIDQSNTT